MAGHITKSSSGLRDILIDRTQYGEHINKGRIISGHCLGRDNKDDMGGALICLETCLFILVEGYPDVDIEQSRK